MLYTGFSLVSGFVIPLIVAVVLGMVFEPVASAAEPGHAPTGRLAAGARGPGRGGGLRGRHRGVGIIDQGPEIIDQLQKPSTSSVTG